MNHANDSGMMMMPLMTFHFSSQVPGGLLFSQWKVTSVSGELDRLEMGGW
jgi:hypothetical protein